MGGDVDCLGGGGGGCGVGGWDGCVGEGAFVNAVVCVGKGQDLASS